MKQVLTVVVLLFAVTQAGAQSIQTEGNIETDGQLVSKVAPGTAPLQVSSSTKVDNLNADSLDGRNWREFALYTEVEDLGVFLINLLDNPDPPCFNNTHRFVDCGNGTVTDTATGLIWLKDAGCFPAQDWQSANQAAAALWSLAANDCGLSDGSRPGDWRLPTLDEWEAIRDSSCTSPPKLVGNGSSPSPGCYSDNPWATGVVSSDFYWSSTTHASFVGDAWGLLLGSGNVGFGNKAHNQDVWPVRGGQ